MKKLITIISLLMIASVSEAQQALNTQNVNVATKKDFDHEQITVDNTVKTLTASKINPTVTDTNPVQTRASLATCIVETGSIRILSDGNTPSSSDGLLIAAGGNFTVNLYENLSNFKTTRATGVSGTLTCQYSRVP